jgi:hypothetical protein
MHEPHFSRFLREVGFHRRTSGRAQSRLNTYLVGYLGNQRKKASSIPIRIVIESPIGHKIQGIPGSKRLPSAEGRRNVAIVNRGFEQQVILLTSGRYRLTDLGSKYLRERLSDKLLLD